MKSFAQAIFVTALAFLLPHAAWAETCGSKLPDAYAKQIGTGAYMLLLDGRPVAAYGDVSRNYRLHSIRKSLVSVLVGIAVGRGEIALDSLISESGIDDYAPLSQTEKRATLRQLMESRSGVYRPATHENRAFDKVRPAPGSHVPGSHWFYSNWDFNTVGSIYQIQTGRSACRALIDDIARPLGMRDFSTENCAWRYSGRSRHPAYVFRMSARDLASFGELMRRGGNWNGKRIVPSQWVALSTAPISLATRPDGTPLPGAAYGLMWWTSSDGRSLFHGMSDPPDLGPGAFVASGTGSQFLVISPNRRLVFAHLTDTDAPEAVSASPPDVGCLLKLLMRQAALS